MRIFELGDNKREVMLDGKLNVKETIILESIEGDIFRTIYKKITMLNRARYEKYKKAINTIAMSPILFQYLRYLAKNKKMFLEESIISSIKQIFGLKIVIRDDYEIDEVDFYRDVTLEYSRRRAKMNKELTPLEVSNQLKEFVLEFVKNGLDRRFIHGSFDIIETALKEIETPTETFEQFVGEPSEVIYKKLKALEIIIMKNVKIDILEYESDVVFYNMAVFEKEEKLTKEEFKMLKEVLL